MKNQNEMYQKEKKAEIPVPAVVTAKILGVSPSLVTQVRSGKRNANKGAGAKVLIVDDLLKTGQNALVEHIKSIVNLEK